MKKYLIISILFIFVSLNAYTTKNNVIGKIKEIKGNVYFINLKSNKQKKLFKNSNVLINSKILTGKNSYVLIQLKNGALKLILENSKAIISNNQFKYKNSIDKLAKIGGVKGNSFKKKSNLKWVLDDNEEIKKEIKNLYSKKEKHNKYVKIVLKAIKSNFVPESSEYLHYIAFSYLFVDLPQKSIPLFKKLLSYNQFEYKESSIYGLFLSLLKSNQPVEAKKLILKHKESKYYNEMTELLGEKY